MKYIAIIHGGHKAKKLYETIAANMTGITTTVRLASEDTTLSNVEDVVKTIKIQSCRIGSTYPSPTSKYHK